MQTPSALPSTLSIRQALNALARQTAKTDIINKDALTAGPSTSCERPDLGVWIGTDGPALALYKRYLDARAQSLQALLTNGKDSIFSQTAADMADSAWCALEARLYELRTDAAAAARADLARKLSDQAAADARLAHQRRRAEDETQNLSARVRSSRQAQSRQTWLNFLLFWYWCQYAVCPPPPPGSAAPSLSGVFAAA